MPLDLYLLVIDWPSPRMLADALPAQLCRVVMQADHLYHGGLVLRRKESVAIATAQNCGLDDVRATVDSK